MLAMEGLALENLEIELEQEDDGRWIAEVTNLPGVLVYGVSDEEALAKVRVLAQKVITDRIKHGEAQFEPRRVRRQVMRLFEGLELDGYQMPNGEFRVGIKGASKALGYSESWLDQVLSRGEDTARGLRGVVLLDQIEKAALETGPWDREIATISLDDFMRLVSYSVFNGNKAALALQLAFTKVALNEFFKDAFEEPLSSIDEARRIFYETYAATISPDMWRHMGREEILELAFPGNTYRP